MFKNILWILFIKTLIINNIFLEIEINKKKKISNLQMMTKVKKNQQFKAKIKKI